MGVCPADTPFLISQRCRGGPQNLSVGVLPGWGACRVCLGDVGRNVVLRGEGSAAAGPGVRSGGGFGVPSQAARAGRGFGSHPGRPRPLATSHRAQKSESASSSSASTRLVREWMGARPARRP